MRGRIISPQHLRKEGGPQCVDVKLSNSQPGLDVFWYELGSLVTWALDWSEVTNIRKPVLHLATSIDLRHKNSAYGGLTSIANNWGYNKFSKVPEIRCMLQ